MHVMTSAEGTSSWRPAETRQETDVYSLIKQQLVTYTFVPGTKLHIVDLADRLRVSTTPIREAVNRLAAEGLLIAEPHKGFFVKPLNLREFQHLYEAALTFLRFSIVKATARHSCIRTMDVVKFVDYHEELPAGAIEKYADRIEAGFALVASLSENIVIYSTVRNFLDRTHYIRLLELESPERARQLLQGVEYVVKSLGNADATTAHTALTEQIMQSMDLLPKLVKEAAFRLLTQ